MRCWRCTARIRVRPRKLNTACVTPSTPKRETKRIHALKSHFSYTVYVLPWRFTALKLSFESWCLNTLSLNQIWVAVSFKPSGREKGYWAAIPLLKQYVSCSYTQVAIEMPSFKFTSCFESSAL